ncbi:MAG TPA: NAD(P)H-dependent glycerol-3-phosphate dehydrogenase, partial [Gemmatimonadaceae bacterium]|nr:NAD(P)H-dependent glycerol-3-phosphate dehydrogenase [Gemmatimonadaceae bacterium]
DMGAVLRGADVVFYTAPSHVLRQVASAGAQAVPERAILVVGTKGLEPATLRLMSDVVAETVPGRPVVVLSGPSFAIEVAQGQPTAVVAASSDRDAVRSIQLAMSSSTFRVYTSDDVVGVAVGGALKNVMAVAAGIAEGLELGLNSRAALITRGLAEMTRLGAAMGANVATFSGLAGLGDLVLTCTGALSRNRSVGIEVGRGRRLDDVLAARETVAEGVTTTRSAYALSQRLSVEMPIVAAVQRVLFEGQPPRAAMLELMTRELRAERDA